MGADEDSSSGSRTLREHARRQVDAALDELRADEGAMSAEMTAAVSQALSLAQEALAAERTECRQRTPYSELMLVGEPGGLHYECSHDPVHIYPL